MAIITVPDALKIRRIEWNLSRPAQVNHSGYTGRRKVMADPWHGKWSASVELPPLDETQARAMRQFFAKLKGQINTFQLRAVSSSQTADTPSIAASAAAGASTLSTSGWTASTTPLVAGQFVTIGYQLCLLTEDVTANASGNATLTFEPPLRYATQIDHTLTVGLPFAMVAMASPDLGWTGELAAIYGFSFSVEEVFIEQRGVYTEYLMAFDADNSRYWQEATA